jgi:peptidoglycan-N-acetylglucosamine deacetylase
MYLVRTPRFLQKLFPKAIWRVPTEEKKLYLTFDDGPTPEITEWVLEELNRVKAKATFFVLGKNVKQEPEIFQKIISNGHAVGNHSFTHLNGWETEDEVYFEDVERCLEVIRTTDNRQQKFRHPSHNLQHQIRNPKSEIINHKSLFRPPYGRITMSQYSLLTTQYQLIMWDVLSGDFDHKISGEQCFENCRKYAKQGSIIVFHDSHKAYALLKICLPKVLDYFSAKGFTFHSLDEK